MLLALHVRDFILIDDLELRFDAGFNVLTGETGAGKSVLIGALSFVLGRRPPRGRSLAELVRPGATEACVEALFDVNSAPDLERRLADAGVSCRDGELVIRRIVSKAGRSRTYLNGRICAAAELAGLAPSLAAITAQHDGVTLTDPARHLDLLDGFAGLDAEVQALGETVDALTTADAAIRTLVERAAERAERRDFLAYQLQSVEALEPEPGELDRIDAALKRLSHAERLQQATQGAAEALAGGGSRGEGAPIETALGRVVASVRDAATLDPSLAVVAEELDQAWRSVGEAARELCRYNVGAEADPAELERLQERRFALQELLRRHGPTMEALEERTARWRTELDGLEGDDTRLPALEAERAALYETAAKRARALSRKRTRRAKALAAAVQSELRALGMGHAVVALAVSRVPGGQDAAEVDGARLTRRGIDRAELCVAMNKGAEPKPIRRVASGGELSRTLLAIERVVGGYRAGETSGGRSVGVQVFDEIDAGTGGLAADAIGRAIADVAARRQVLCITHLAPIAAYADGHYVVQKSDVGGAVVTQVEAVKGKARAGELARMLTGAKANKPALRTARQLLRAAEDARRASEQPAAAE